MEQPIGVNAAVRYVLDGTGGLIIDQETLDVFEHRWPEVEEAMLNYYFGRTNEVASGRENN